VWGRGTLHLVVLGVFLAGLLASGGAEPDPYHAHLVIGGTPAERARALAAHLRHEAAGTHDRPVFGEAAPAPSSGVRVFSLHGQADHSAVWSGGGIVDFLAPAPASLYPPRPAFADRLLPPAATPNTAPLASDPPPRLS
jgi:hypothetical protein